MVSATTRCPVLRFMLFLSTLVAGVRGFASSASSFAMQHPVLGGGSRILSGTQMLRQQKQQLGCSFSSSRCSGSNAFLARAATTRALRWAGRRRSPDIICAEKANGVKQPSEAKPKPVLILGAGWVGSRLAQSLQDDDIAVTVTNRPGTDAQKKPPYFRPVELACPPFQRVDFKLDDESTWEGLPPPETLSAAVLTFPVTEKPSAFWEAYLSKVPSVLAFSTTSVYQVDQPGQSVDETTPLKGPRAEAEEYMRQRGATVLTIAGIFGDQRTPRAICTCLSTYTQSGGAMNGRKQLNMVHVEDIVAASRKLLASPLHGERINVAGHHFFLSELVQHCKHPAIPDAPDTDLSSKCVCSQRLLDEVMPEGYAFVEPIPKAVAVST